MTVTLVKNYRRLLVRMRYYEGVNFIASMQIALTHPQLPKNMKFLLPQQLIITSFFFDMTKRISDHQYSNQKYVKSIQLLRSFRKHPERSPLISLCQVQEFYQIFECANHKPHSYGFVRSVVEHIEGRPNTFSNELYLIQKYYIGTRKL